MLSLKKEQKPIAIVLLITLIIFGPLYLFRQNYEFLFYVGIIVLAGLAVLATNKKVNYPNLVLWSLAIWAILHMAGGGIYIQGKKLYELILIPLVGNPYYIFKYDQFVHIVGFGAATLLMFYLIKPYIKENLNKGFAFWLVVAMAGLGVGAINEIVEFIATVVMPETGVGGYENTSLDLVADLVGAVLAVLILKLKKFKEK